MGVVLRRHDVPAAVPAKPDLSENELHFLNHIRVIGLRCRASRRAHTIESCALISAKDDTARALHAETLMRALPQAIGRTPVLFKPGTAQMSFDESWLLQLANSISKQDTDSVAFLLGRRVPRHAQRGLTFLMRSVSEHFSLT